MDDNDIIKFLEEQTKIDCNHCAFKGEMCDGDNCEKFVSQQILDIINRQKAEIDKSKMMIEAIDDEINPLPFVTDFDKAIKTAKDEAIKAFVERFLETVRNNHYVLSDKNNSKDYGMFTIGIEQAVNETEKMVGVDL